MKVALLQVRQDVGAGAANLQLMIAAIDRAGRYDPAPDLLILPGACDTGGQRGGRRLSDTALHTVGETIAAKAREWGVYIAAGLHVRREGVVSPCSILFDPDGDRVAWGGRTAKPHGTPAGIGLWRSETGSLGVLECDVSPSDAVKACGTLCGTLIAWPCAPGTSAAQADRVQVGSAGVRSGSLSDAGAYWGVVGPAGKAPAQGAEGPTTFVCDPDGHLLASVAHTDEALVVVEVPIEPAPEEGSADVSSRGGRAG